MFDAEQINNTKWSDVQTTNSPVKY